MATIQELLPYLQKGYTIQSMKGESIRILYGSGSTAIVEWCHHDRWGSRLEAEKCNISKVASIKDLWEWGAVFADKNKKPFLATEISEIEREIANGTPRVVYGELPE